MAEKKKRRVKRSLVKVISIGVIAVSIAMLFQVGMEILSVIDLQSKADAARAELERLQEENASLISRRDKLEDPDYVQTYARGNYMFSKDGEKIFYLPGAAATGSAETEPESTTTPESSEESAGS